jgi:hypothetical protein
MSSGPDRDEFLDYLDDKSQHEDETLFMPVPDSRPDSWSVFYSGILIGIIGGSLIALAPWLSGLLVFAGYGVTAMTFKGRGNRLSRALRFGFGSSALFGAAILGGETVFPETEWGFIEAASNRHLTFAGIALMPWAAAVLRYAYALFRPAKSSGRSTQSKRILT